MNPKKLFVLALVCAIVAICSSPSYALGRRRGGGMMVCNVAQQAPVQATAENLVQTAAKRVLAPTRPDSKPVLIATSRSGAKLSALAALNARPTAPATAAGELVAGK